MKKGAIIGLGAGCFVVIFAVAVLALGGSSLTLTQNEVPTKGIEEIQSEFDYMQTLPITEASVENIIGPLFEEMLERPSVIDTCTKIYNQVLEGQLEIAKTSDRVMGISELEYEIANSPKLSKLYENKEVLVWCMMNASSYPDKFPDAISNEEFQQRLVEALDKK